MKALDLIKSAMRLIFVLDANENPTNEEAQTGLMVLNQMVDAWDAERLMTFTITIADYPLTPGQQDYTLGPGGNLSAIRPTQIERISIITLGNPNQPLEIPIEMLTDAQWAAIPVKNISTTIPLNVYEDGGFPLRTLSFWGIPSVAVNTRIYSWTLLTQFASLSTDNNFPPGYFEAIRYNLAVRLAPEFGEDITPALAVLAAESKARIKSSNIPIVDLRCDSALTGGDGAAYDWRSDSVIGGNR